MCYDCIKVAALDPNQKNSCSRYTKEPTLNINSESNVNSLSEGFF